MNPVVFPFERAPSKIFGSIYRPVAAVNFWSLRLREWCEVIGIVDTGADYVLLPKFYADDFGIRLKRDCKRKTTKGVGGEEGVFLCPKMRVSFLGEAFVIPVGFLNRDDIPPLLGRHKFLDRFRVSFHRHKTYFESKRPADNLPGTQKDIEKILGLKGTVKWQGDLRQMRKCR